MDVVRTKRIRRDADTTRGMILDVTERIMVEEGYAAVSSRRIAQEIGLNPATVLYYYRATDDIFIALHRRMMERQTIEFAEVLAAENPLEALWRFQSGWAKSALGVEFIALSNHRKGVREVISHFVDAARERQAESLVRALGNSAPIPDFLSPIAVTTILLALARTLANEERVGITSGHKEVRIAVEWALRQFQKRPGE